jgi:hypothetical protein
VMAELIKMITVLSRDKAIEFIATRRVTGLDTMPQIHKKIKEGIRNYIRDNVGYDDVPIASLSKLNGFPGELKSVGTGISDYIPTKAGTVLFELHMPEDMVVSVSFGDLLAYSKLIGEAGSVDEQDMHLSEFLERIQTGYTDDEDDVISFIPFIDQSKCKFFALIDQSWDIGGFSVPGADEVKLANMEMF